MFTVFTKKELSELLDKDIFIIPIEGCNAMNRQKKYEEQLEKVTIKKVTAKKITVKTKSGIEKSFHKDGSLDGNHIGYIIFKDENDFKEYLELKEFRSNLIRSKFNFKSFRKETLLSIKQLIDNELLYIKEQS